ncbi:MAG: hypothetical protein IJ352_10640 [Muribaculaceae bacterium]|nr:hypothetical protein [Muribaculaceae bacterium]MBQ7855456.1 hypothetical protein [Muribaculaceae bacterium]
MENWKHIHIKTYIAEEVAENQFKVINEINSESTSYDEKGNPISGYSRQNDGNITTDIYYENGLLVKEDSGYHTTTNKYDDKGNLIESVMKSDAGEQSQNLTYDANGNVIKEVHYYEDLFSGEDEKITIRYSYDEKGNLIERITKSCEGKEIIKICNNNKGVKIAEKLAHESYFEITEFDNDEKLTERRYHCKAKDAKTFLETNDFKKELFETKEIRREQKTEGDKFFDVGYCIVNNTICSKEIIISDIATNRILKYYEINDCDSDSPVVTEKTIEYWN